MRIGSSVLALATAAFLLTSVGSVQAQEIPQPLFGNCCSCKAQIKVLKANDILKIGARVVPTPTAVIDPVTTGMSVDISNANGAVMSAVIPPGAFEEKRPGKFVYRDKTSRKNGGISNAIVQERNDQHGGWLISIKYYGDLSSATLAEMTTDIVVGTSPFFDTSDWLARPNGWRKKFQQ